MPNRKAHPGFFSTFCEGVSICVANRHLPTAWIVAWRRALRLPFKQHLRCIELEITTACNLGCTQCDRSCGADQALSRELMTVDQVRRFVAQSVAARRQWLQIKLLGGEPSLHPELGAILDVLRCYRDEHSRGTRIDLISNGYGRAVQERLAAIPADVRVHCTWKETRDQGTFETYNVAPCDLAAFEGADFCVGCVVPEVCGMALTRYGYYPCGAGASVDRVFGMGLGIRELQEATAPRLMEMRGKLCRYCGHFKSWGRYARFARRPEEDWTTSPSWKQAYAAYASKRPDLPLF